MAERSAPSAPLSIAGTKGSPLGLSAEERGRYAELARRPRSHARTIQIAARTGEAFVVEQGQILRVTCSEGPQVADFIVFGRDDPRERFSSGRSRIINGPHLSVGSQLWSMPPNMRPMLTIVADTVSPTPLPHGARTHDLLFTRCDARHYELIFGKTGVPNCQDNLTNAIARFGLDAYDVHDPLNLFMTTGTNEEGRPFYLPSEAKKGDHVELYAEIACIIAISACPGGSSGAKHRPLTADIYDLTGR